MSKFKLTPAYHVTRTCTVCGAKTSLAIKTYSYYMELKKDYERNKQTHKCIKCKMQNGIT